MDHIKAKQLAHSRNLEFIVDRDGDVCVRPMLFDEQGVRQARYYPDPIEFVPEEVAAKLLGL